MITGILVGHRLHARLSYDSGSMQMLLFCSVLAVDRRSTAKDQIFSRDRSTIYTSVILIASGRSAIYRYGNVFLLDRSPIYR